MTNEEQNQWEDIENAEYTDDFDMNEDPSFGESSGDYSEFSDEEESDSEENQEYEEENSADSAKTKKSPILLIVLLLVLLGVIGAVAIPKIIGNKNDNGNTQNQISQTNADQGMFENENLTANNEFFENNDSNDGMYSVDFSNEGEANITTSGDENSPVATVSEASPSEGVTENDLFNNQEVSEENPQEQENSSIMVAFNKVVRSNPFKPPVAEKSKDDSFETFDNDSFEIIEPPVASVPDEALTRLLQTQISGILYDNESPSAIVNLNGQDKFVKIGDVVSGYRISNITRNKVEISYKNNSYVAAVGELFTPGKLEKQPAVANLEQKFAGRYRN